MSKIHRKKVYRGLVAQLPGTYDDTVQPLKTLRDKDLIYLTSGEGLTYSSDTARPYSLAIEQECHAVSAYAWLRNPGWKLVCGFASLESCCGNNWVYHSFCIDQHGLVVEPTPLMRYLYWGVVLEGQLLREAVEEELGNIKRLKLGG